MAGGIAENEGFAVCAAAYCRVGLMSSHLDLVESAVIFTL